MIDTLKPLIKQFMPFAQKSMGFKRPPRLFLKQDSNNAANPLGKTAFYDPQAQSVTLYVTNRHPKDVMRSLSHELVHHTQNCNGDFEDAGEMGEGYTQNNPHMREMERQAYEMGNLCFRDWEDGIKGTIYFEHLQKGVEKDMSTKDWKNKEIKTLLTEQWGFSFNLDHLNEDYTLPGGGGDDSQPTGDTEDEEKAGEEETSGTVKEEDELDETRGLAKRRGKPMTPEEEEEEGYDPSAEVWKRGVKGKEVEEGLADAKVSHRPRQGRKQDPDCDKDESGNCPISAGEDVQEGAIQEDSGEEESTHYSDDSMSDEDHIKAIRHHLKALEGDRDYDEGHDDFEDKGMEERRRGRSRDERKTGPGSEGREKDSGAAQQEAQLRAMVREALKKVKFKSNKGK